MDILKSDSIEKNNEKPQKPQKPQKYKIKIDRQIFEVESECMTGKQILELAGKIPIDRFQLNMKLKGGKVKKIGYEETVCFSDPGLEKFMTLPLDQTEGESLRKDFALLEEDEDYLNSFDLEWETIIEGNRKWILIHNHPIPEGYNVNTAMMAIQYVPGYPTSQLDMVYFYPNLSRIDNKPITALAHQSIQGKIFQRWSRHRTPKNPWRPGIDDLSTHVSLAQFWLEQEFIKRPKNAVPA